MLAKDSVDMQPGQSQGIVVEADEVLANVDGAYTEPGS
jgi:hypothetical protein